LANHPGEGEGGGAGERRRIAIAERTRRDAATPGEPEGEMPTRRVPDRDDASEIESMVWRERPQVLGGGGDIDECAGPAAARLTDPPVLDIPTGDAARGEVIAESIHQVESVAGAPVATVDKDDDRVWPHPARHAQIAEAGRRGTVAQLSRDHRHAISCRIERKRGGDRSTPPDRQPRPACKTPYRHEHPTHAGDEERPAREAGRHYIRGWSCDFSTALS
jgi:hypothetical protein